MIISWASTVNYTFIANGCFSHRSHFKEWYSTTSYMYKGIFSDPKAFCQTVAVSRIWFYSLAFEAAAGKQVQLSSSRRLWSLQLMLFIHVSEAFEQFIWMRVWLITCKTQMAYDKCQHSMQMEMWCNSVQICKIRNGTKLTSPFAYGLYMYRARNKKH